MKSDHTSRRCGQQDRTSLARVGFGRRRFDERGCGGRISVLKRRHGLNRCRYRGDDGMKRWVGLGVIADNLINIGRVLALRAAEV